MLRLYLFFSKSDSTINKKKMLYSKRERTWLPIYVSLNNKILYLGYGKVALAPIETASFFMKKGMLKTCGTATSEQDIEKGQEILKSVDVLDEKQLGENVLYFEYIYYTHLKVLETMKFPFKDADPLYRQKFGEVDSLYKVFDMVNKKYKMRCLLRTPFVMVLSGMVESLV